MSAYEDYMLSLGPQVHWALNDITGMQDTTGNGHDGTASGTLDVGGHNSSPLFDEDSSTDFSLGTTLVQSSFNPFTNGGTKTYVIWVYIDTLADNYVFLGSNSSTLSNRTIIHTLSNQYRFSVGGGITSGISSGRTPDTGKWQRVTVIHRQSADNATFMVDGEWVADRVYTPNYAASPGNMFVGILDGKMAHVSVYDRELTEEEILRSYALAKGKDYDIASLTRTLTNAGNYNTKPTVKIYGGMSAINIKNNTTGEEILFKNNYVLADGDYLTIDTKMGTIVDQDGNNQFSGIQFTSDMIELVPGDNAIEIPLTKSPATTWQSKITIEFQDAWI